VPRSPNRPASGSWRTMRAAGCADSAALAAWLKTSPVHIEEFLGVSAIARDLKEARTDPEYSLEAILARARAEDDTPVQPLWPRVIVSRFGHRPRPLAHGAVAMAACAGVESWLVLWWNVRHASSSPRCPTASRHCTLRHDTANS
jgi:ferric-dicitrate binding protein FerR (iron transport regulator)